MENEKKRPIHEVKVGRVRVAIWEHTDKKGGSYFRITTGKLYKTEDGKWRTTTSLALEDIPNANKAQDLAFEWARTQSDIESKVTEHIEAA